MNELEFLEDLRKDINSQIRSYAPLDKVENSTDGNDFKDSVQMLRWVRGRIKKRLEELKNG